MYTHNCGCEYGNASTSIRVRTPYKWKTSFSSADGWKSSHSTMTWTRGRTSLLAIRHLSREAATGPARRQLRVAARWQGRALGSRLGGDAQQALDLRGAAMRTGHGIAVEDEFFE